MVNYNGSLVALNTIPISQVKRALSYGDGLFETMRMREGKGALYRRPLLPSYGFYEDFENDHSHGVYPRVFNDGM